MAKRAGKNKKQARRRQAKLDRQKARRKAKNAPTQTEPEWSRTFGDARLAPLMDAWDPELLGDPEALAAAGWTTGSAGPES
ncbi:MAG: hypothetical protein VX899_03605 [Myxococcota bacterium]|nr:hypothetical protein [Myxococcota bacterium]